VIDIGDLRERLADGQTWVMWGADGELREPDVPTHAGAATLIVSKVTEAVKRVGEEGFIDSSVDRRGLWTLEAVLLNRVVVEKLEEGVLDTASLLDAVTRSGFGWQVVTVSR
jgi:hypothetical protein